MKPKVLWQAWLLSPAIVGATFLAASGALAQEVFQGSDGLLSPIQGLTEESAIAKISENKLENLEAVEETEAPVPIAKISRETQDTHQLQPLSSNYLDSAAQSLDLDDKTLQLSQSSSPEADPRRVLEQINEYGNEDGGDPLDQVTNVNQLRDVSPGDWAFEALRSLVERYGCIAGYPDGTFRGNRAMTRFEFAAGLNACLQQVERLLTTGTEGLATKQDLEALRRLVEEFSPELATLRGRVDGLEARTSELEATQFSTTTKLTGEVIFGLASVVSGETVNGFEVNQNPVLGYRARLDFDTSFTGRDVLRTRLQSNNLDAFSGSATFTPEGDLRFAGGAFESGSDNNVEIDALLYAFPIGEKTTVVIEANAGAIDDFTNTVNPLLDGDGGNGALTQFGTRNPIYYLLDGAGLGLRHEFSDRFELSLGYLASDAANPEEGAGLFDGPYGAIAQLTFKPIEPLTLGLTYIHSYNTGFTSAGSGGSIRANLASALASSANLPAELQPFAGLNLPTSTNAYGVQASFQFSPKFFINGWVGYTNTRTLAQLAGDNGAVLERGDYSTWNYAVNLVFPDLGTPGSVAGIIFGMEPKVTGASGSIRNVIGRDQDTSFHVEAFYQFRVTENIAITPAVVWLTAPDHNSNNDDIVIGAVRTTFTF
jgi:hypothetical protein